MLGCIFNQVVITTSNPLTVTKLRPVLPLCLERLPFRHGAKKITSEGDIVRRPIIPLRRRAALVHPAERLLLGRGLATGALGVLLGLTLLAIAPGSQHLHSLHNNFGRVAFHPVLLPGTSLEFTFAIDLPSLVQILGANFSNLAESHDPMPFCALLAVPVFYPALASRHRKVAKRVATGPVFQFRIGA